MIKIYDTGLNLVADIADAHSIGYEMRANEIWTASFTIPADDPHAEEVTTRRYAEVFDGDTRVDLFRIKRLVYSDGATQ